MNLCPKCGNPMKEVMHFTSEKNYKTKQCPKCHYETKPNRLKLDNIIPSSITYNNKN